MGRKLDALLGRKFKTSKFKATVNLAVSRLAVLKNQRQARLTLARSDIVQLLSLGHHEHALLRVDQMIKEQNMLDVYEVFSDFGPTPFRFYHSWLELPGFDDLVSKSWNSFTLDDSNGKASILVNGVRLLNSFIPRLETGDPLLCRFLFLLIMDPLHLSFSGQLKREFSKVSGYILRCFSLLSGIAINIQKSHLLGVVEIIGRSKKAWDETINKMKKRLSRYRVQSFWKDLWIGEIFSSVLSLVVLLLKRIKNITMADRYEYVYLLLLFSHVRGGVKSQQAYHAFVILEYGLFYLIGIQMVLGLKWRWWFFQVKDVRIMLMSFLPKMEIPLDGLKDCPDELKEAASSLLYAAPRCGEFPELQEIRAILTARYGKEFANGAIDLRNNCGVSTRMIQKLSPRKSSLETRMKILNEIAAENDIVLKLDDSSPVFKQGEGESKTNVIETNSSVSADDFDEVLSFTESRKGRNKYRNAEDAAQDAFESAAYAAAAARAAVELSRSRSFGSDNPDSPNTRPRKVLEKSKLEIPEPESGPEHEMVNVEAADETSKNNTKDTNGDHLIVDKPLENNVVFDESDNEIENEPVGFMSSKQLEFNEGSKVHQLDLTKKPISVRTKRVYGR
ncbi:IST1-like protein [Tanacetum coccineum]